MKNKKEFEKILTKILSEEIDKKSEEMSEYADDDNWVEIDMTDSEDDELTDYVVGMIDNTEEMIEQETEEGNAFTGALEKARDEGKSHFEVDGKKYPVKETVRFTESELIDLIERIVLEQESKTPAGLKQTNKILTKNKKENDDYTKEVTEKMNKYLKLGSKGKYDQNPDKFPQSNYDMDKDLDINKYDPSEAVEEYIEAFSYPGQTNIRYDEIKPSKEKIAKHLKGDSMTGNATKDSDGKALGNVVDSEVGEKFMKNFEDNLYGIEQSDASYKRYEQPVVDTEGNEKDKGKMKRKSKKILNQLESKNENYDKIVTEDLRKIKNLISYNTKTQ